MSFLGDLFGGATNAANSQNWADIAGLTYANNDINAADSTVTGLSNQALAPYTANQATANQGTTALGNLLGLNGASGSQSALTALQTTPGYQFALGQGNNGVNAAAAANGTLGSGNQLTALSNYDSGLAQNTYNTTLQGLLPYLGFSNSSAAGGASVLGNEANTLNNNALAEARLVQGTASSIGNNQANADLANQSLDQSLLSGGINLLGSALGGMGGLSGIAGGLGSLFGGSGGTASVISDAYLGSDIMGGDALYGA